MGCASSIVPQQQQQSQQQQGHGGRPKHKLNALVPEPPARPASPALTGPRVGLVSSPVSGPSRHARAPAPAASGAPAVVVIDPQNYEELCVAFLKATKRGDVPAMEVIAQLGVELTPTPQSLVNIRGMWDSTPLVYATQYAHAAAAHWLLARGADVLAQNEKGVTALLLASLEGMTDVCDKILSVAALMGLTSSAGTSNRDERGGLTAPRAVDQQVGVVYNSVADVNVRLSPLLAASMNGHAGVVALLLAHGADPNRPVGAVVTGSVAVGAKQFALLLAAKYGHVAVLQLLLVHGVDCSVRDTGSSHAVLLACENRREDCALLLLQHAAYDQENVNGDLVTRRNVWLQPNRHGLTALHLVATHGLAATARALVSLARQQTALDCGDGKANEGLQVFLDAVSITRGETALLMACRKRQFEVARVLLEAGADAACADRGGTTPAQVLERSEQSELLALCGAAAVASSTLSVVPTTSVGVEELEPSAVPGASPPAALASSSETIADDSKRGERNSQGASVYERRKGDDEEPARRPSGGDAGEGDRQTAPSFDAVDQVSRAEAARPPEGEFDRIRDAQHEDGAEDEDDIVECLEIEARDETVCDGDGDGDNSAGAVAGELASPPVGEECPGTTIAGLAAGTTSLTAPTTVGTSNAGVTNELDVLSAPDSGDSFVHSEADTPGNATAAASATVVPAGSTIGDVDRVMPSAAVADQDADGRVALDGDPHEPTILPVIAIERDGGRISAEDSSPRRKKTEGNNDDRAPSTSSVSPKKEKSKKSSKRKKKRDKSDQDQLSSSSSTRHHHRHRHKVTEESTSAAVAVDPEAGAAVIGQVDGQATVAGRVNRRSTERTVSDKSPAQVT